MIPKFISKNRLGRLSVTTEPMFQEHLMTLPEDVVVTVRSAKEKDQRSLNQNSYLWAVVYKLVSDETGYHVDDIHELMKSMFLKKWLVVKGKTHQIVTSTTELKTDQMESYLSDIREWASKELSLYIPLPNEFDL